MASSMRFTTLGASTLSASAQMDSLANEGNAAGSLISASQRLYSDWFIHSEPGSVASGHLALYFVTNFGASSADGSSAIDPPNNALVGVFPFRSAACAQSISLNFIPTPNRDFTPVIINKTGVTLGASKNFLYYQMYDINPDA